MKTIHHTSKTKATKVWANLHEDRFAHAWPDAWVAVNQRTTGVYARTVPSYLITQEQIEACVEKMARVLYDLNFPKMRADPDKKMLKSYEADARAALKSIDIKGVNTK